MAFVKLDCTILRSTIWFDRPAREIFITSLLLAEPREFTEPVSQIAVGALEETGWNAPPGWYGFVPASGPGIVHVAGLPLAEGMAALVRLGDPEPESRSQDHGGRRLIRVDGGFVILNYMKHREKDHTSPLRSARYRERLKLKRHTVTSHEHAVTSHTRVCTMPNPPERSDPEGVQGEPFGAAVIKVNPQKGNTAPADLEPRDIDRVRCQELKFDAGDLMRAFKLQEFNRDYSDWPRRFSKWIEDQRIRRETEAAKAPRGTGRPKKHSQPDCGVTGFEKMEWK